MWTAGPPPAVHSPRLFSIPSWRGDTRALPRFCRHTLQCRSAPDPDKEFRMSGCRGFAHVFVKAQAAKKGNAMTRRLGRVTPSDIDLPPTWPIDLTSLVEYALQTAG